jgi:predicted nucleic acid-binding protein
MTRDSPVFVLDTHAILAYLFGESAGAIVRERLSIAYEGGCRLLISAMSICEVSYIVERRKGVEAVGPALALDEGATVVTGDPEFQHVEHLVPVLWSRAF